MISLSTTAPHRFTPAWREGAASPPVFLIRAGSVLDRASLEAELAGEHQAGRVFAFELLDAFTGGITALLDDDPEHQQLIALAQTEANGEKLDEADSKQLAEARTELAKYWPEYRELIARGERRREIAPILAFRRFVVGWENIDVPFARGRDGLVTLDAIAKLDWLDVMGAGNFAYGLLFVTEPERNFPQPSASDKDPPSSPSDASSKEGGKSKASAGRKTRA